MSFTNIETALVQSYGRNVQMMAQQTESRLRDKVRIENPTSERHYFELYNEGGVLNPVIMRNGDLQYEDTYFERRACDVNPYEAVKLISKFDEVQMLADPLSPVVMEQAARMGRTLDSIIISSVFANMLTGKSGGTSVAPATGVAINSWAYGTGSGNSNLTISKILEAKATLDANEVPSEGRYFVADSINITKLLATAEASSRDFVSQANLENGELKKFAGFEFVRSELLPVDGSGFRRCFAFHRSGIGLAMAKDIMADVSENKTKSGLPYQAYICMVAGATRLENEKVVEVKCLAT